MLDKNTYKVSNKVIRGYFEIHKKFVKVLKVS
jgi:hypothetical protein